MACLFPNICGLQVLLAFILDCQNSMVTAQRQRKEFKSDTPGIEAL